MRNRRRVSFSVWNTRARIFSVVCFVCIYLKPISLVCFCRINARNMNKIKICAIGCRNPFHDSSCVSGTDFANPVHSCQTQPRLIEYLPLTLSACPPPHPLLLVCAFPALCLFLIPVLLPLTLSICLLLSRFFLCPIFYHEWSIKNLKIFHAPYNCRLC